MTRFWFGYGHRRHADPVSGAPALDIRNVVVRYPNAPAAALDLDHVRIEAGQRVALVGANGSGKSTLLKSLAGLLKPQQGHIRIHGLPVGGCHHRLSYLAQRNDVDWHFPISVERLVVAGRFVHLGWLRRPRPSDWELTWRFMDRLGIRHLAKRQIGELSGGQQQRAMLARSLAQQADLLLLDEPLNAVDVETRRILAEVFDELRQAGKTIVIATHDHGRSDEQFDQVISLHEGRRIETPPHDHDHSHDHSHDHPDDPGTHAPRTSAHA